MYLLQHCYNTSVHKGALVHTIAGYRPTFFAFSFCSVRDRRPCISDRVNCLTRETRKGQYTTAAYIHTHVNIIHCTKILDKFPETKKVGELARLNLSAPSVTISRFFSQDTIQFSRLEIKVCSFRHILRYVHMICYRRETSTSVGPQNAYNIGDISFPARFRSEEDMARFCLLKSNEMWLPPSFLSLSPPSFLYSRVS